MDKVLLQNLSRRIKELRKQKGFSQDDLSFHSNIARSTIGNIETAKNDLTFTKLYKISQAFEMSLSEFLNF